MNKPVVVLRELQQQSSEFSSSCRVQSNHCEQTVCGLDHGADEPLFALLAAVFVRRRRHYGCIWRDLSLNETLFSFGKSTFVEQMEMYR